MPSAARPRGWPKKFNALRPGSAKWQTSRRLTVQILARLNERKDVDGARREILDVERVRLAGMLAECKRQIDRLQEEEMAARRVERLEKEARREALMPTRRL